MKKIILAMVFVFASVSIMNANINIFLSPECFERAELAVEIAQNEASTPGSWGMPVVPLDFEDEYDIFVEAYDKCESSSSYDNFQFLY